MYKVIFFSLTTGTAIMTVEFHFDNDRCYKDKIGILNENLGDIIPISYTYIFSNLIVVKLLSSLI